MWNLILFVRNSSRVPKTGHGARRAHLSGRDDCLVKVAPLLSMISDWRGLLDSAPEGSLKSYVAMAGRAALLATKHSSIALRVLLAES